MKNILSRNEYLQQMDEGFIKDTIKKGIDKVKSLFRIGMKKIKDFIVVFDNEGKVLPVVTPQAVIDNFADKSGIKVYAQQGMNASIVAAGGKGCDTKASPIEDDEIYDFGPDGKEFSEWMSEGKYKDTIEYKNLMSIPSIIKENYDNMTDDAKKLFENVINEDWESLKANRVTYGRNDTLKELHSINVDDFEELLNEMIDERIFNVDNTPKSQMAKNVLIFGAPGIGKSTIPNLVIDKYNSRATSKAEEMSLITVDCPNIAVGDFMMPTMPQPKMVQDIINKNPEAFPQAKKYLDSLTPEQQEQLEKSLAATKQFESNDAPKAWLPSYKKTGDDEIDTVLDAFANGGVYTDDDEHTHKTGNGGIIMFDEFLRSDPNIFKQLMIFLLTRHMSGWTLGSKWVIIACSNRPCDDQEVETVWDEWTGGPAAKDRFERMFHLEPNPEQWKNWARKKGCDELLLKFIFEKSSMVGAEYPRWHSMERNATKGGQIEPISPRRWESAINFINKFEKKHHLDDISQMELGDISKVLGGVFDESFVVEITTWMKDHMDTVSLEEIIKDPMGTYLPKKFSGKDQARAGVLVKNIFEKFKEKYENNIEDCTDKVLSNIVIWFGRNYKGDVTTFNDAFFHNVVELFTNGSKDPEKRLSSRINTQIMLQAAWPQKDTEACLKAAEDKELDPLPKGSFEKAKEYMREYFPWRIDGDKIHFYDDLD